MSLTLNLSGGYLLELHTRDDFHAYQERVYDLLYMHGKSTGWIATGGKVFSDTLTNFTYELQWENSRYNQKMIILQIL